MNYRKQSGTTYPFRFYMVQSADHLTGLTGATPTVQICKTGSSSFASAAGAVTEIGSGWYSWAGNATDRNTLGELSVIISATDGDTIPAKLMIVPWDVFDGNLSLTSLDGLAAAGGSGGLPTADSSNGVKVSVGTGTGQISLTSGQVTAASVVGSVGSISGVSFPDNFDTTLISVDGLVSANVIQVDGQEASQNSTVDANIVSVNSNTFSGANVPARVATGGITAGSFAANAIDSTAFAQNAADLVWNSDAATTTVVMSDLVSVNGVTFAGANVPSKLDLTQAIPSSNTAQTVGDALNAARAQGFGKWVLSDTTLNLYASDGVTIVRSFDLDSSTHPTTRT